MTVQVTAYEIKVPNKALFQQNMYGKLSRRCTSDSHQNKAEAQAFLRCPFQRESQQGCTVAVWASQLSSALPSRISQAKSDLQESQSVLNGCLGELHAVEDGTKDEGS